VRVRGCLDVGCIGFMAAPAGTPRYVVHALGVVSLVTGLLKWEGIL
jgi:hypothetical protein